MCRLRGDFWIELGKLGRRGRVRGDMFPCLSRIEPGVPIYHGLSQITPVEGTTDGSIIEGEEQKSMATLLKRTGITQFAPNFSKILFMVIEMELPREFPKS